MKDVCGAMADTNAPDALQLDESAADLFATYLRDHRAGAVAGRRLAKRLARENEGVEWGTPLAQVAAEIAEDERALAALAKALSVDGGGVKRALAAATEIVARSKLNRRFLRYSPLSRLLELETLMAGVLAKQRLWVTVQRLDLEWSGILSSSPPELERRAQEQIEMLAGVHDLAARAAFGRSGGSPSETGTP